MCQLFLLSFDSAVYIYLHMYIDTNLRARFSFGLAGDNRTPALSALLRCLPLNVSG